VRLDLLCAPDMLSLEVSDNGRGLSSRDLAKARSFGIRGLQERAATVGGWIDLSSSAQGTTLLLSIPIEGVGDAAAEPAVSDAEDRHDPSAWGDL